MTLSKPTHPGGKKICCKEKQAHALFLATNDGMLLSARWRFCFITLGTFPGSPVALQGRGRENKRKV